MNDFKWVKEMLLAIAALGWVFVRTFMKSIIYKHPISLWQASRENDVATMQVANCIALFT
jgi:hypothetical protein